MMKMRRLGAFVRVQAQVALAARDHQPDVAVAQVVLAARLQHRLAHRVALQRDGQQNRLGRVVKPVEVLLQEEDAPVVKADALKHAVAVKQAVIEHGNLGVRFVHELAVEIDFQVLHGKEPIFPYSGLFRKRRSAVQPRFLHGMAARTIVPFAVKITLPARINSVLPGMTFTS